MNTEPVHIGVDMAKASFDAALPSGISHLANTPTGFRAFLRAVRALGREACVYVEATGGYERPMCDFLLTHGIAVAKVNPKRVRDFARGLGKLAKTDTLDAVVIGEYGRQAHPRRLSPEPAHQRALTALVRRRDQLTALITVESNRLGQCHDPWVKKSITGCVFRPNRPLIPISYRTVVPMISDTLGAKRRWLDECISQSARGGSSPSSVLAQSEPRLRGDDSLSPFP